MIDYLLNSAFSTFQWKDALDIALMATIFYSGLLVMRGTRAFQSLVGLLALGVIYFISDKLDLYAIHWLLSKFFVYIVLAVVILFQHDIRQGLARAGGSLFAGFRGEDHSTESEVLVRTLFSLASRRIGALIVLEREASLDHFLDGGHHLGCSLSMEILQAIFHPTSPLHDGAVVIRSGQIEAAQVFLPLTRRADIERSYGTRHRAAIGLSEETDAICLVASEERGAVSIAVGGVLQEVGDINELRGRLQRLHGESSFGGSRGDVATPEEAK